MGTYVRKIAFLQRERERERERDRERLICVRVCVQKLYSL